MNHSADTFQHAFREQHERKEASWANYGLMLFIIWSSGLATEYTRGPYILLSSFAVASVYLVMAGRAMHWPFMCAIAYWFFYIGLSYIKYPGENQFWPFLYLFKLTVAFAVVAYFGRTLSAQYCACIEYLCAYSLLLYAIQLLFPDAMMPLWSRYDMAGALFDKSHTYYAHAFGYTIHQYIDTSKGFPRNSGFAWEPGAFASFIVIAWVLHLMTNGRNLFLDKRRTILYLLAILTTQSSTGFLALAALVLLYALRGVNYARNSFAIAALIAAIAAFGIGHVEKLSNQLQEDVYSNIYNLQGLEGEFSLNRIQSLEVLWYDFIENPLIGIGANRDASWLSQTGLQLSATSGWGNFFATYGLFLALPYLWLLVRSSRILTGQHAGHEFRYGLVIVIGIVGVSFSILETPVILALVCFSLFCNWNQST